MFLLAWEFGILRSRPSPATESDTLPQTHRLHQRRCLWVEHCDSHPGKMGVWMGLTLLKYSILYHGNCVLLILLLIIMKIVRHAELIVLSLDNWAHQQSHFHITIQCNISLITSFVRHTLLIGLTDKPDYNLLIPTTMTLSITLFLYYNSQ